MAKYNFKGYTITNCGYHQPDHCVWWEAVDENGEACFHGNTLREVEFMILDYEWEQKMKDKDAEIERLKSQNGMASKREIGSAEAMRDAAEIALTTIRGIISGTISRTNNSVFDCRDKLKAALSALPRNCDRFNSGDAAKDAADAYDEWQRHCDCSPMPPSCKGESSFRQWLFGTSDEKE